MKQILLALVVSLFVAAAHGEEIPDGVEVGTVGPWKVLVSRQMTTFVAVPCTVNVYWNGDVLATSVNDEGIKHVVMLQKLDRTLLLTEAGEMLQKGPNLVGKCPIDSLPAVSAANKEKLKTIGEPKL